MTEPAMIHHQVSPFLEWCDGRCLIQLWLAAVDPVPTGVFLRLEPDNEERLVPMQLIAQRGRFQVYQADLIPDPADPLTVYAFKLLWADRQRWLDAAGASPRMPLQERFFRVNTENKPPDWVPDQVFYQIFPERFRNGDPGLSPRTGAYAIRAESPIRAKEWGEPIDPERPDSEFYGGDLIGVRESLDYLDDLGVTAISLNPIFTSPSVHKYDIEDFEHVDPYLGGNHALADLRVAATGRGMRLVLDAVFNHTSDTHPWFNRWGTHAAAGAYQGVAAPSRGAYTFQDSADPESYHCWQGAKSLPVLDFGDSGVREYFLDGQDSIVRRWLRPPYSIDGWRIDVAHMLGEGGGARHNARVLRALRRAAREESPRAYILGEHFAEATRWLQGDQEDGAMNYYGFAQPVRAFLAAQDVNYHPIALDAAELEAWLTDARSRIPYANQLCQLNLLGSHDTARFLTLVGEDPFLMRLAFLWLFVYPGVPCIYYGDEIGMAGRDNPYNRACFDWDEDHWDQSLRAWVQTLAHLRRESRALRRGAYQGLLAVGDLFGFARCLGDEVVILIINRGNVPQAGVRVPLGRLPGRAMNLGVLLGECPWGLGGDILTVDLGPKEGLLLRGELGDTAPWVREP
ncbi:maltodextrin glucosidase [uncultured Thiodictyon sp.]|uniref:maltodextrin glucosidase n=1 Tax=uncultured Thiodictyon sp. TaxID=1846217 RepID=UPI0025F7CC0A|nr:maltodextrin glucosidase [uncultured Thiodictyon sp.]